MKFTASIFGNAVLRLQRACIMTPLASDNLAIQYSAFSKSSHFALVVRLVGGEMRLCVAGQSFHLVHNRLPANALEKVRGPWHI